LTLLQAYETSEDYHAAPGINATSIKRGRQSMLAMHHAMTQPSEDSPAKRWGRLVHGILLEPERCVTDWRVWEGAKRGKAWAEFQEDNAAYTIITRDEAGRLEAIHKAVRSNPDACRYLDGGDSEVSVRWQADAYGLAKARLDKVQRNTLVDVKTTSTIQPDRFWSAAYNYGYHLQFGWYRYGYATANDVQPPPFCVVVVESSPPHDSWVARVPDPILDDGYAEAAEIAHKYKVCCDMGCWPGVASAVIEYELPRWADWTVK